MREERVDALAEGMRSEPGSIRIVSRPDHRTPNDPVRPTPHERARTTAPPWRKTLLRSPWPSWGARHRRRRSSASRRPFSKLGCRIRDWVGLFRAHRALKGVGEPRRDATVTHACSIGTQHVPRTGGALDRSCECLPTPECSRHHRIGRDRWTLRRQRQRRGRCGPSAHKPGLTCPRRAAHRERGQDALQRAQLEPVTRYEARDITGLTQAAFPTIPPMPRQSAPGSLRAGSADV